MVVLAGNPAAPAADELDIDGDAFGMSSACPLVAGTRDIGADELKPVCVPDSDPVPGSDPPSGSDPVPGDEDTTAPDTSMTHHPPAKTSKRSARFSFASNEAGVTYMCRLDQKAFAPCSSPTKLKHLKRGRHTLAVEAIDSAGNADPTPATSSFRVARKHHR